MLATLHRQENVDNQTRLASILEGFSGSGLKIILPLHPRTKKRMSEFGLSMPSNVQVIEPVGYLDMVMLEKHASIIATDSGGVQKEAYFHKIPCVTLRDETEWVELVEAGVNDIVGACTDKIIASLTADKAEFIAQNFIYGNGDAGNKIVSAFLK